MSGAKNFVEGALFAVLMYAFYLISKTLIPAIVNLEVHIGIAFIMTVIAYSLGVHHRIARFIPA